MQSDVCCAEHAPPSDAGPQHQSVYIHYTPRWSAVMRKARTDWPDPRLDHLIDRTVADIKRTVGSKRAAVAWTGGKDSLVLAHLAGLAGIHRCVLTITNLEFPGYLQWVTDRMPDGLTVVSTGQDLEWLGRYPHMLFPQGRHALRWHTVVQQQGQQTYYDAQKLDVLLLGHRRIGDYAFGPGGELTWRNRAGTTRYTPLVHWTHEAMLALVQREGIPLPPCYGWPRGGQVGPGPWPARLGTTSICHGFDEVWEIDRDIVRGAAEHLPQAKCWLAVTGRA